MDKFNKDIDKKREENKVKEEMKKDLEPKQEGKEIDVSKSTSTKITESEKFGTYKGDLRVYKKNLEPIDFNDYPKFTITVAEDLDKFQYGYIVVTVKNSPKARERRYIIQIDGLLSLVYSVYAKTLNNLRKATIRQKTVRVYGIFRKIFDKIFKK